MLSIMNDETFQGLNLVAQLTINVLQWTYGTGTNSAVSGKHHVSQRKKYNTFETKCSIGSAFTNVALIPQRLVRV